MDYREFIRDKSQFRHGDGFHVDDLPEFLFPFQRHLVQWALAKGRAAIWANCGLGKTAMQLAWASEIIKRENKPVLLLTPIAVGAQTVAEAQKFGVEAVRTRDGVCDGSAKIWVTNYQQLAKYDPGMFAAVVCDESSCIKDAKSTTKAVVTEFLRTVQYRLLCTATAAPNDFHELGTSSEALGMLGFRDMITTFFKMEQAGGGHAWGRVKYRFRGHAEEPFWAWVCSFARSMRIPSDLGFSDDGFILPPLVETEHIVEGTKARKGRLFSLPGNSLQDEREERRNSIDERCQRVYDLVTAHNEPAVMWCELDDEGNMLEKIIPGAVQVHGRLTDEQKEERLQAFSDGQIQRIVIKPKIGAWGLNWQHCRKVVSLPSHSYEQYYQAVRRCYRFGQKSQVDVDLVVNEGEFGILENLRRKAGQADKMFSSIVRHMQDAMHLETRDFFPEKEKVPSWL